MSQKQPPKRRERDPTYGLRVNRVSLGNNAPPAAVLELERIRAYRIARRCRGLSHEEAEDLAQDYCLKIVQVWQLWDQERPILPFLNTLLFRELANHGRRSTKASLRGRLQLGEFGELDEGAEAVIPEPNTLDTGEEGDTAIRHEYLSLVECPINRAILELTIEGFEVDEIVEILGLQNKQRVWNGRDRGRRDIRTKTQAG